MRPLWLDEILQLIGTRDLSGLALYRYARTFPGAGPFGYWLQHEFVRLLGASLFAARLPSALASLLSCAALWSLARKLRLRLPWVPVLIWAALPLQLRYAAEARPYAQALLFSIAATWCFLNLRERPTTARATWYGLAVAAAVYSAPFTIFLQAGYVSGLLLQRAWKQAVYAAAVLGAGLCFVPWHLWSTGSWSAYPHQQSSVYFSPKFWLLPLQEISGGGYACSLPVLLLAFAGFRLWRSPDPVRTCLLSGAVAGLFLAIFADAAFHYFFAIRQVMFILVPLTILAAAGVSELLSRRSTAWAVPCLLIVFSIGSAVKSARYFSDRSEDWEATAQAFQQAVDQGACPRFENQGSLALLAFFQPTLQNHACEGAQTIVTYRTRYTVPEEMERLRRELERAGYTSQFSLYAGAARLSFFARTAKVR